jgi:hypothetical protein
MRQMALHPQDDLTPKTPSRIHDCSTLPKAANGPTRAVAWARCVGNAISAMRRVQAEEKGMEKPRKNLCEMRDQSYDILPIRECSPSCREGREILS